MFPINDRGFLAENHLCDIIYVIFVRIGDFTDEKKEITADSEQIITEYNGTETSETEETETSIFSALKTYEFCFTSGIGGWMTTLTILPNGTFFGEYHDSNIGEDGMDSV